jgi:hypothetical protein
LAPNAALARPAATMSPPSAGPTARATLNAAELSVIACAQRPRHEIGYQRLERRHGDRRADAQREHEPEQPGRGQQVERRQHRHRRHRDGAERLPEEQHGPPVHHVGERAGGEGQQQPRQRQRRRHQRDEQRRAGHLLHQPRRRRQLQEGPEVRDQRRRPDPRYSGTSNGAKVRTGGAGSRPGAGSAWRDRCATVAVGLRFGCGQGATLRRRPVSRSGRVRMAASHGLRPPHTRLRTSTATPPDEGRRRPEDRRLDRRWGQRERRASMSSSLFMSERPSTSSSAARSRRSSTDQSS